MEFRQRLCSKHSFLLVSFKRQLKGMVQTKDLLQENQKQILAHSCSFKTPFARKEFSCKNVCYRIQAKFQAGSFLSASFWQHCFDKYSETEQSARDKAILVNSLQSYFGDI